MALRRVRWRNVGRVACLAAAGVLIATHEPQGPPAPPPPARPRLRAPARVVQRLPRLRDLPRLVVPRPRERRALKRAGSGRKAGPSGVRRRMDAEVRKAPENAGPTPPSPSGGAGQPEPRELS